MKKSSNDKWLPKKIAIAGQDITITYHNDVKVENTIGLNKLLMNEIYIRTHFDGQELPFDQIAQTLCHEIVHGCLNVIGTDLAAQCNSDEGFVDSMAHLLYQVMKSAK